MNKKILFTLFLVLVQMVGFAQTTGDYRSNRTTGNWNSLASWQYYNGSAWITPSGTSPQGYPGQFTGTGVVTIRNGNSITLNANITNRFTALIIGESLTATTTSFGNFSIGGDFQLNTLDVVISKFASLLFTNNKGSLFLPKDTVILIDPQGSLPLAGGPGDCNANVDIWIGDIKYGVCTGNGALFNFTQIVSEGGTLNSKPGIYSPICGNVVNLLGSYSGVIDKDLAVTYSWTASGPSTVVFSNKTSATTSATISDAGTYLFTLKVSNGAYSNSETISVLVNPLPSTPKATNTNATCASATGTIKITSPALGDGITFTVTGKSPVVAAVTNTTGVFSGLAVGTYNVTAKNSAGCVSLPSADVVILPFVLKPNTWNGTVWSTGSKPSSDGEEIIFEADYDTKPEDLTACTCVVKAGVKVIIKEGKTLKLTNGLTVEDTVDPKATLTFENNSSLVQVNKDAVNKGVISYIRSNNTTRETDYTYWSSPVAGQKLIDVSPKTPLDYFYSFDADVNNWIYEDPNKVVMKDGKGYIIRGPHHTGIPPTNFYDAPFKGVPNNGDYEVDILVSALGKSNNLIGNPYPSALDAESFIKANSKVLQGTLYFWTHNTEIRKKEGTSNEGSGDYVYITDDYASYNLTGSTSATSASKINGIESPSDKPSGKIASGQGFFATGEKAGKATFKNTMRVGVDDITGDNGQFFKTTQSSKNTNAIEKNRVWLNLTNDKGAFKQVLVGYITDATNGYDNAFDGANNNGNQFINFYSINEDKNLTIQGRALPFDENDVVSLGYSSTIQGSFSISIDEVDGLLTSENIYLEDKSNNSIHDLKKSAYTFDTEKGTFNERFVLRYTDRILASADFELNDSSVLIAKDKSELKIKSNTEIISQIVVFDLLGRKVFEKTAINSNEFQTSAIRLSNQVVVVKVTLTNGEVISKKVVY